MHQHFSNLQIHHMMMLHVRIKFRDIIILLIFSICKFEQEVAKSLQPLCDCVQKSLCLNNFYILQL